MICKPDEDIFIEISYFQCQFIIIVFIFEILFHFALENEKKKLYTF